MKFCPNCHIECEDKFSFCNQCGSKLQEIIELVFCPFCGNKIETEGDFCPYCGNSLPKESETSTDDNKKKCTKCRLEYDAKFNFCKKCGAELESKSDYEKLPNNLFNQCDELEKQAICKNTAANIDFDEMPKTENQGDLETESTVPDIESDATYAVWYSKEGLFSLRGRRSRAAFFAIDILLVILLLIFEYFIRYSFFICLIITLLFIYINITNASKRLHDLDKPATFAIIVYILNFVGQMIVDSYLRDPEYQYYWMMVEKYMNTEFMITHMQVYYERYAHVGFIFLGMVLIPKAILYIMMLFKGTDGPNRYGHDPLKLHESLKRKPFEERDLFGRQSVIKTKNTSRK